MEVGVRVLRAMATGQRAMMLKDIAAAAGMAPSKAHRYLVSLIRSGLVEQDPANARYDLGPFALSMGLVALDRLDRIRLGQNTIAQLRDEVNETTALAVWGGDGPVIVRWERPRRPITVNVTTGTTGTTLDLLSSGTGLVFAAWLPQQATAALLAREMTSERLPEALRSKQAVNALLERIRSQGYATTASYHYVPGVAGAAAPVFNVKNEISMALLTVGVQGMFDCSEDGAVVHALKRHARQLSERLGATLYAGEPISAVYPDLSLPG